MKATEEVLQLKEKVVVVEKVEVEDEVVGVQVKREVLRDEEVVKVNKDGEVGEVMKIEVGAVEIKE